MKPFGGFDHNAHALRLVTKLEQRYAEFDGLNLTWETLEGIVKHNGPLTGPKSKGAALPQAIAEFNTAFDLGLDTFPGAEAQVAALACSSPPQGARRWTVALLTQAARGHPHSASIARRPTGAPPPTSIA